MKRRLLLICTLIIFFSRSALTQSIVLRGKISTAQNIPNETGTNEAL